MSLSKFANAFFSGGLLLFCSTSITPAFAEDATPPAPKIIGGTLANEGAWPFMAALVFKDIPNIFGQFCGASLIKPNWAITAAHCVFNFTPDRFDILVGQTRLSANNGERIAIKRILIHPNYNPVNFDSDMALLELAAETSLPPIKTLGQFSVQDKNPQIKATVLGWGDTSPSSRFFPDVLHQVSMPIIPNAVCNQQIGGISDNMLCIGVLSGGEDSCQGDSGGPAVLLDPENQTLTQIGIVSFGYGCAQPGFPGVYTRVAQFSSFISKNICTTNETPATPILHLSVQGQQVTATWNAVSHAEGYRLNYAPFPAFSPIESIDVKQQTRFSVNLPSGSAFYVAINAYNFNCRSDYSNIEYFVLP